MSSMGGPNFGGLNPPLGSSNFDMMGSLGSPNLSGIGSWGIPQQQSGMNPSLGMGSDFGGGIIPSNIGAGGMSSLGMGSNFGQGINSLGLGSNFGQGF